MTFFPFRPARLVLRVLLVALALAAAPACAEDDAAAGIPAEADLFAMPAVAEALRAAGALAGTGEIDGARQLVEALAARHPRIGIVQANRAALAMLAGEPQTAIKALEALTAGSTAGSPDLAEFLRAPVFAPLAADPATAPRLAAALEGSAPAEPPALPFPVPANRAAVEGSNTRWNPATERLEAAFAFPDAAETRPVLFERPVTAAHDLLREHWRRGRAAGHAGDLYDNRDRGHSALADLFPQLARTDYAPAAREAGIDYGLNDRITFDRIAFGNSSTALTGGPHWRSLPRHALTRPDGTGPMRLWQNWAANHLYVHPAHHDWAHDQGDLFPANTPYLLVSRGSSGSDQPFLEAIALILAAFPPATKARLAEERLVVPTVQMVFRRSLQHVRSRENYFSGAAHPPVFERRAINLARMISLAQSIAPGDIPAEARIAVLAEELGEEGIDFFGQGLSEQLFDTPSAAARIWRARVGRRHMTLSAEDSRDANGRPLTFHWRLLQGDPDRVQIEPEGNGARARVTIDWHDPFPVSDTDPQTTARVDIAVFAHNGVHDSAPAILSWYFPPHEARRYVPGPEGAPRIEAIDYAAPEKTGTYADPLLLPRAGWRDTYRYDGEGALLGWSREEGGRRDEYAPNGARILLADAEGRPVRTERVRYPLAHGPNGTLLVEEVSAVP